MISLHQVTQPRHERGHLGRACQMTTRNASTYFVAIVASLELAHGFNDWIYTAGPGVLVTVIPRRRSTTYLYGVETNVKSYSVPRCRMPSQHWSRRLSPPRPSWRVYFLFVCVNDIYETSMAWYSLFVLKVPLDINNWPTFWPSSLFFWRLVQVTPGPSCHPEKNFWGFLIWCKMFYMLYAFYGSHF